MRYVLFRQQQLNCGLETAWEFFSLPENLPKITPKDLRFAVLSDYKSQPIFEGMIINYTVSPILGIPLKWKTRITELSPQKSFIDFQEKGPYRFWSHFHEFLPNEDGVLMRDTVEYELPFGILGSLAHRLFVKRKLCKIFDYRFKIIESTFNQPAIRI